MSTSTPMSSRDRWSHTLTVVGSIAMVVGAVDPMEGSLVILPGSGLVAVGAYLGGTGSRWFAYRLGVFVLIALGVGALWGLSGAGGFGADSGRSMWWGLLVLPYLVGWSMGIWGPRSPRWLLMLGMAIGYWYLVIMAIMIVSARQGTMSALPGFAIGATGIVTIVGCIKGLRKGVSTPA